MHLSQNNRAKRLVRRTAVCAGISLLFLFSGCQPKPVTKARMYMQNSEWQLALEELERAVEAYPENEEVHFLLGFIYGQDARYKEMTKQFNRSLSISNKFEQEIRAERDRHWKENYNNGIKALDAADFERAAQHLVSAITIDSTNHAAHKKLALSYEKTNETTKALAILEKLLVVYPTDMQLLLSIADLYSNQSDLKKATVFLHKILELQPNHRDAMARLADCYETLDKHDEAEKIYLKAVTAFPLDRELIFKFGIHHYKTNNFEQSIQLFERVLELDPNNFEATSNIGNAYLSLAEDLRRQLKGSSAGSGSSEELQKMRDQAILGYKKSIPYLQRALELQPDLPNLWRNLGVAYVQTGEKVKGEEAFRKSEDLKVQMSN